MLYCFYTQKGVAHQNSKPSKILINNQRKDPGIKVKLVFWKILGKYCAGN